MKHDPQDTPRASTRFAAGIHGEARYGGKSHPCSVENLSRTGVLIVGKLPTPQESQVELTLKAPAGTLELSLTTQVARFEDDPSGDQAKLALQLQNLSPDQNDVLESLIARVLEGQTTVPLADLQEGATPEEVRKALDRIPVPHRMSLASRAALREREYLRQDPNPQVLESLARNPVLLPEEIRAIAVLRHLLPTTLELIAKDRRWRGDEELKLIVASQPRTPFRVAQGLVADLRLTGLRKMLQNPGLTDAIRAKVLERIGRLTGRK